MAKPVDGESPRLHVDPEELHLTAGRLDSHAYDFLTTHFGAHSLASVLDLGSGSAAAARLQMLAAWADDGVRFGERYTAHADGHRNAANRHTGADQHGAAEMRDLTSGL